MAYDGSLNQQHLQDLAGPSGSPNEQIDYAKAVTEQFELQAEMADRQYQIDQDRKRAAMDKTMQYMDRMPDGVETSKVPAKYSNAIEDWSKEQQMKYADYSEEIAIAEANGDFKTKLAYKRELGKIERAMQNLNDNLSNFKSYKDQWLDDVDNGNLSNGNNSSKISLLGSIYTDEMDMQFDDDGNITFTNNEGYVDFHNIPNYTSKNNKGATSIIETNESLYNSGNRLTNSKRLLLKNKLKNLTADRDELLSLATDDFIIDGGLGITDQSLLYDTSRTNELRERVVDNYMSIFNDTANSGYANKQSKSISSSGGGTLSDKKYNAQMSNINQGFNLLSEGDTGTLSRVIKGELVEDPENPGMYYYMKGNIFEQIDPSDPNSVQNIYLHEGIPQNYWGRVSGPSQAGSQQKDADYYLSQLS